MAFVGEIEVPGDKSISHRAVILNSAARGSWSVGNLLESEDVMRSIGLVESVGVEVEKKGERFVFVSPGRGNLREPQDVIDCGNSGTTMRIGSGLLASIVGLSVLTGDEYLRRRPMDRIAIPLRMMGARVDGREDGKYPPLAIKGGRLESIDYQSPVPSAQVKSAILLAGICSSVEVSIEETVPTRDHTERMLSSMGAKLDKDGSWVRLVDSSELNPVDVDVPGDFSSAAFFIAGAAVSRGSELKVKSVLLNPYRTGFLRVLERMGARIAIENRREISGEPVGDIIVKCAGILRGTKVERDEIPSLVDEVPVLAVVAAFAEGVTEIRGASELRVKESDRLRAMATNLRAFGVKIEELEDGLVIEGKEGYEGGGTACSFGDHRIVMAMEVFAFASGVKLQMDDRSSVKTSFPGFYEILRGVVK